MERPAVRFILAALALGAVFMAYDAVQLVRSWNSIERVPFDPEASRAQVLLGDGASGSGPILATEPLPAAYTDPDSYDAYLILGLDSGDESHPRADAILLFLKPGDGSPVSLVSIPRLLYVPSPCTGEPAPINRSLEGCGTVSGTDLLAIAIEDYTGIVIDHFVQFDFDGFETIIDRLGGIEICIDHAVSVRPMAAPLLPQGCTTASGAKALLWVRRRRMFELVKGEWGVRSDIGDQGRRERQRAVILQMFASAQQFSSFDDFRDFVTGVSDSFVLDEGFELSEAISLAWDLRRVPPRRIATLDIPVSGQVTSDGEYVLVAETSFAEVLESG